MDPNLEIENAAENPASPDRALVFRELNPRDPNSPYWSNQHAASSCTRHAIAKAVYREISGSTVRLGNEIRINVLGIYTWLINATVIPAGRGAYPTQWNMRNGILLDVNNAHHYEIEIQVKAVDFNRNGHFHVVVVDMNDILPPEFRSARPQMHAMFHKCDVPYPSTTRTIPVYNSWGDSFPIINLDIGLRNVKVYFVKVTRFVRQRVDRETADLVLCENGNWRNN